MKFEGSLKEVLNFIEQKSPETSGELRKSMTGAIISLVGSAEMKESIKDIVNAEVKRAVQESVRAALSVGHVAQSGYRAPKKELEGYMAEEFKAVMGDIFKQADGIEGILRDVATDKLKYLVERYEQKADSTIEEHVKRLIPYYVTEQYRERVAEHFEMGGIGPMLEEMLQQALGKLIMSGALSLNMSNQYGKAMREVPENE